MGTLTFNNDVREHILEVPHDELLLGIVFGLFGEYLAFKEFPLDGRDVQPNNSYRPKLVVLKVGNELYGYQVLKEHPRKPSRLVILPFHIERVDKHWCLARDQELTELDGRAKRNVVVFGCGSLGSSVAELLARAGIGSLTLVDPELFGSENVARHVLGINHRGISKAKALASKIAAATPWTTVRPFYGSALDWLRQAPSETPDVILDLTGERSVRLLFSGYLQNRYPGLTLGIGWLEPYGAAAHVVLLKNGECWPMPDPAETLINAATWVETGEVRLPACGAGFHPYGAADAVHAATLVVEKVIEALDAPLPDSLIWSHVRSAAYFSGLPVKADLREIVPRTPGTDAIRVRRAIGDLSVSSE